MQRIYWIDNLKTFAIFLVVVGHMMSCDAFQSEIGKCIYGEIILAFHMPLFAVLSGWFLNYKIEVSLGRQIWKKIISILLPYVVWCMLWFFVKPIFETLYVGSEVHLCSILWQLKFFLYEGLCQYGWWYLRALFFCFVFAYLSIWICRGRKLVAGFSSCVFLYVLTLGGIIPNMPEKDSLLKGFVYLYPFFWTGFVFSNFKDRIALAYKWMLPILAIGFVSLLFLWQGSDSFYVMNTSALEDTGNNGLCLIWKTIWRYLVGSFGSLFLVLLFKQYLDNDVSFITKIGQETLGIYILQSLVYWSLPSVPLFENIGQLGLFFMSILVSIMIIVLAFFIIKYSSHNGLLTLLLWGRLSQFANKEQVMQKWVDLLSF